MLDEHNQVFATTLPGRLHDVFGIRLSGYEETEWMNELSPIGLEGNQLRLTYRERDLACESPRLDVIEPVEAETHGWIVSLN